VWSGNRYPAREYLLFMELSIFNTICRKDGEGVAVVTRTSR